MDRFIVFIIFVGRVGDKRLKSNMDRFIETYLINPLLKNQSLKSNMDRFIECLTFLLHTE